MKWGRELYEIQQLAQDGKVAEADRRLRAMLGADAFLVDAPKISETLRMMTGRRKDKAT